VPVLPEPDQKVHVTSLLEAPGGVVANAAVACARAGADCRFLMRTGDDLAAAVIEAGLALSGVRMERERADGRTCRVVIVLEPHGEKRLLLDPGVSMYPSTAQVEAVSLDGVGWVHTAVYGDAAPRLIERCREGGLRWSIDLEPASFPDGIERLRPMIDGAEAVFCNRRAGRLVGPDPAATLLAMGARAVISTLGADGASLATPGGRIASQSPSRPLVKDTTGAGDCLAGWYIAGCLEGLAEPTSLGRAVAAAALSCEAMAAQPSFPDRDALEAFLARK
jgi:ribokinase